MSERDVLFDISRRLTDDEIRAIFLSPMVSTTETLAAVSLRFEVIRARREEENLRAENERLRGELQGVADHLLSMSGGAHNCAGCGFLHKQIARALAAPPEEK